MAAIPKKSVDHFVHVVGTKRYSANTSTLLCQREGEVLGTRVYVTPKLAFFKLTYGLMTRHVHDFQTLDYATARSMYLSMSKAERMADFPDHDAEGKPIVQDA